MIRIGFLSAAHIHTRGFLKSIGELEGVSAKLIWDDDATRGRAYAEEFGMAYVESLDEAIANDRIDAWIITAENTRHLPLLERAIPIGKPVMCEKPLVTTEADLARLRALIVEHRPRLTNGYFMPHQPAYRSAARALGDGLLGRVTHASFRNAHHAAYGRWFDKPELRWFTDPAWAGGGALMDMGSHAVHLLRLMFGPVESVWATTANLSGVYPAVDDWGVIEMRFASGVVGRAEAGWVMPASPGGLEVVGETGTLRVDNGAGEVLRLPQDREQLAIDSGTERPSRVHRLVAAVRGELDAGEMADDLAAALDEVAIMAAAYRSAESGGWQAVGA
ncbi:MAG: Gfo/Idh/MocA family oxidoreductase [Planctomycetota bacterium]